MANLRFPAASTPDVINDLPFEVLDHIFQGCLDLDAPSYDSPEWPTSQHLFPYNASNVCERWRQILTSNRRYWKYVVIDIARDPAPFLDVIAHFHADYKTKGVVIFSSIRDQTPVPQYYTAEFENARAEQIVKRLTPIVSVCTHVIFNLVYQSSLPSVADILRPYNTGLTEVCLTCIIHDCDEAVVGVKYMHYPYPEGYEDTYTDTDSTDSEDEDDLHSSDLPESPASNAGNPPAHTIADETGPHDHGNEPAPKARKYSDLSSLTKLHITGVGLREIFALGAKWQWNSFPPGSNDKLELHINHMRIGPYLGNDVRTCLELNSLTQFTSYIACIPCKITFSDISLHYSVQVDDPDNFDKFITNGQDRYDISPIEFPALTFIKCDEDFIAGFLRYSWIGETLLEVDSPLITFDGCFIPPPYGPREMELEPGMQIIPRYLTLKNIPLDEEDVDEEAPRKLKRNTSVAHAIKWFPYANVIQMENCDGLAHSVLMTLTRDIEELPIRVLELRNCRGFTATTIRDIIERYQYYAMLRKDPNLQLLSVYVTDGPVMNMEETRWLKGGGPKGTTVSFHPCHCRCSDCA